MRVEDVLREDEAMTEPRSPRLEEEVLDVMERREAVEGVREPELAECGPRVDLDDLVGCMGRRAEAIAFGSMIMLLEEEARDVRGEE